MKGLTLLKDYFYVALFVTTKPLFLWQSHSFLFYMVGASFGLLPLKKLRKKPIFKTKGELMMKGKLIHCIELNLTFKTSLEAKAATGIDNSSILKVCKG